MNINKRDKIEPLVAVGRRGSGASDLAFDWLSWDCRAENAGAALEADLIDWIFPLETTYTVQKSGAPFDTVPGISATLNLLIQKT